MNPNKNRKIALDVFQRIKQSFPQLRMDIRTEDPHVDINVDIPSQPGLGFDINLNLQGDELHISAGHFWVEWSPLDDPQKTSQYFEAVCGLISGKYRILESYHMGRAAKAELQRPEGNGWETIAAWANLWCLIPWRSSSRVLQNA